MKSIAIIPARSGSKGLPDKNIRPMNGKPLMAYTIEAALDSGVFDEVMVSTDSEHYAEIAKRSGANVPFLRSSETASDGATTWDTVSEVLERYRENGKEFDAFCVLQPTSPLRTAEDIRNAYDLYREKAEFAVISVCPAEHSPLWCGRLDETCSLDGFIPEEQMAQRQKGGTFYRLNGAIYIIDVKRFRTDRYFYKKGSYAYVMNSRSSIDIDTETDFKIAEFLMREG